MTLPFDPDLVALAHGEGHLIPAAVRTLTHAERVQWYPQIHAAAFPGCVECSPTGQTPKTVPQPKSAARRRWTGGIAV